MTDIGYGFHVESERKKKNLGPLQSFYPQQQTVKLSKKRPMGFWGSEWLQRTESLVLSILGFRC